MTLLVCWISVVEHLRPMGKGRKLALAGSLAWRHNDADADAAEFAAEFAACVIGDSSPAKGRGMQGGLQLAGAFVIWQNPFQFSELVWLDGSRPGVNIPPPFSVSLGCWCPSRSRHAAGCFHTSVAVPKLVAVSLFQCLSSLFHMYKYIYIIYIYIYK